MAVTLHRLETSNTVKLFIEPVPADVALAAAILYTSAAGSRRRLALKKSSVDNSYVFALRATLDKIVDALVITVEFRGLAEAAKVRIVYSRYSTTAASIGESLASLLANYVESVVAGRCEQAMRYASALLLGNGCR